MKKKQFDALVKKDLMDFAKEFGQERLNQLIKEGKLPLRKSTKNLFAEQN